MAGAGYKLFNTGDVLTAQQVNEYLQQQTVMVFANSTARTTALSGVLAEGMMSYLQDTNSVEVYNGSAWVGVSSDQIPLTTKGDLLTFSTSDTRLGVGADGTVLTADSTTATGLKWSVVTAGATHNYQAFTSSTTWTVPSSAKYVDVLVVGGGVGGRGGKRAVDNSFSGGTGGALTFASDIFLNGTGTVAITIGAGSNGTAGTSTTTSATVPSDAGFSAFGTYVYSGGGYGANTFGGTPGYKGTSFLSTNSYSFIGDSNSANFAPQMYGINGVQGFNLSSSQNTNGAIVFGFKCFGLFGGFAGREQSTGNIICAGTHPGGGATDAAVLVTTNTIPQNISSSFLTAVGSASAGTSGTGGGAGGAAGISGLGGGGGTCRALAGGVGGQGGAGAGGGGSWPNPVGGNGGNGGNAGTNTGAGGGAGANTGSTTGGTGGTGGNGAAGIVIVKWIS